MRRFNLYQPAQTTCTGICYRSPCMREFTGKMPRHKIGTRSLCEPAQSKCTWTCPKSHCRKNAAPDKLAARFAQVCAVDMHWDSAQEQFHNGIYCKNCREQMEPPDPTPALTPAVRTRQCRHTAEGQRERRHEPPQFTTLIANVWRIGNRKASKCCRLVLPQARKQCVFSFLQRTQFTYTNYQTTVLYGAFRFDQYLPRWEPCNAHRQNMPKRTPILPCNAISARCRDPWKGPIHGPTLWHCFGVTPTPPNRTSTASRLWLAVATNQIRPWTLDCAEKGARRNYMDRGP